MEVALKVTCLVSMSYRGEAYVGVEAFQGQDLLARTSKHHERNTVIFTLEVKDD
jgi:hypothetical protein